MDQRYLDYCAADRYFYDTTARASDGPGFEVAGRPLPEGWQARAMGGWLVYARDRVKLPLQGWKIHASACMANANQVLDVIWDYCVHRGIVFKHLLGPRLLFANNSKHADRGSSAKLATIYPLDEEHFGRILAELAPLLDGQAGPYILSDLRWGNGPLYVRYGGFAKRHVLFDRGEPEPAIEDPAGRLVPDRREPAFRPPAWVTLPDVLAPHLAARNAVTLADVPYRIDRALHFSNGGGVYVGTQLETGEEVVLKEGRPHAGLDGTGADAVSRLERERKILTHLDDIAAVPSVRDAFTVGEHHFLVQELMPGTPLGKELAQRFPFNGLGRDESGLREYVDWAVAVIDDVERNVAALREHGVVFGDLHQNNIIVGPDGRTSLIDFEVASFVGEGRRPPLGHPAFHAPPDRSGFDVDRYALACLRLSLFLPMTTLFPLDPGKVFELAAEIEALYPLPDGYLDGAVATISGGRTHTGRGGRTHTELGGRTHTGRAGRTNADLGGRTHTGRPWDQPWPRTRDSLAGAILTSATPDREDRLFPGDIEQFTTGGLNFAYGAAGVLYAIKASGGGTSPDHEQWLVDRARRPDPDRRPGFYDGTHGIAYALDHLGHRDEALALLERDGRRRPPGLDLFGGLAGVGLSLLHFATVTGDAGLRAAAVDVAATVAARLGPADGVPTVSGGNHPHAGLLRGSSGPALLFIRMFEATGDSGYLDLAATALDQDLRRCVLQFDGSLQVDEGRRTMPYLATGSVGIGLVLRQYLPHRADERYTLALEQIALAARCGFYAQSGLFNGRAGILLFHSGQQDDEVARQVRHLGWHKVDHRGHFAFPGDQLYRLSMDLGTGTAGVLLALAGVSGEPDATLPFLRAHPEGGDW